MLRLAQREGQLTFTIEAIMKVCIAGSRSIVDQSVVFKAIADSKLLIEEIITGGAAGVDKLAQHYGSISGIKVTVVKPNWRLGRGAALINNKILADMSDALIAIYDGQSNGTLHMINAMKAKNKKVVVHVVA